MKTKANGIDVNYEIEGEGPWLTMSHSLACNLHMWDEEAKRLSKRYKVLRYDTRGHGASGAPAGAYTLELLADDLHALLQGLGVQSTHFVGLSMGGMIGQTYALKYPGMFKSLALCDTTSRYPAEAAGLWTERIKTVEAQGMEALVESTLARWFTEPFRKSHPQVVDKVAAMIRATPVPGYVGCSHAIPKINLTARLKEIACPVVVIVGKDDPGTPVAMAEEIHQALPGSKLVIIPSAAHLSNLEQPDAFNQTLTGFLEKAGV
ncbi:MAG: 3-oxoadipate enol-lactonase [Burkholderiales bacterium]|nr:3-oxoadipate enol-lactonase [Burkholderiales bacterium]MCJ7838516.1 3-oxoadipate enol-lactonase [Burkholderiales bacterium]